VQIIKAEGGQLPIVPVCLDHAELWARAIHFHKEGTQQRQGKSQEELLRELSYMVAQIRPRRLGNGVFYLLYSFHCSRTYKTTSVSTD